MAQWFETGLRKGSVPPHHERERFGFESVCARCLDYARHERMLGYWGQMQVPRIKICGISTPDALAATIAARADYAGFNFHPPSPRFVGLDQAKELAQQADGKVARVGLFVDAADGTIADVLASVPLDVLQLHGTECPARVAELSARYGLPVWKVISIAARADLDRAQAYVGAADFVLLDAKTPAGSLPGGMGLKFDWALLSGWKAPLPWGLAGGLTPDNVAAATAQTGAPLIDAASGVESAPGIKDPALIAAFCQAARAA